MIDRERALELLRSRISADWLIKHCLAAEAILRRLARRLGRDEELWGLTALLHDLDFELTKEEPSRHTLTTVEWLRAEGFPEEALAAIQAHNAENLGLQRVTEFDYALSAGESITGLIVAAALVRPDKKLEGVEARSVIKRMKEKSFARAVSREQIRECEKLGLPLEEFVELSLEAMKGISGPLGL